MIFPYFCTGLDEVDAQVKVLQERLNKFTKEAAITEIQLNKTTETIKVKMKSFVRFQMSWRNKNNVIFLNHFLGCRWIGSRFRIRIQPME